MRVLTARGKVGVWGNWLSDEATNAVVLERETDGPYRPLRDLLRRTGLPRLAAEHLIAVGALSDFEGASLVSIPPWLSAVTHED